MPSKHAKLSPSDSERWISCPAAIAFSEGAKDEESEYAAEGTAAHSMGELKVSHRLLGSISRKAFDDAIEDLEDYVRANVWDVDAMHRHTDAYVALVQERAELYPQSQVLVEQRMDTGVPMCWGTSDIVIVSPEHIEIIDFKYGQGVAVAAEENPQLRLYALGALDTFGHLLGETKTVRITVHQPRLNHVLTDETDPDTLVSWRDEIIPIAESALDGTGGFGPSEEACRWCPMSGRCQAQLEEVFGTDFESPPGELTEEQIADTLGKVKMIKDWLKSFEEAALTAAYSDGKSLPGYKVVMSGGRRVITDVPGAVASLAEAGYDADDVAPRKLNGFGVLEKLLGDSFDPVLGDYISKTEGRPSLVKESDRRKAANPASQAINEFKEN